ncbi:hypothetical protein AHiyo8_49410 [Arthrobacter sp. Hiyo8]|nr:hypothetical protein AHiyo8_49410 [Arthrobacter sp. Hiyo8]
MGLRFAPVCGFTVVGKQVIWWYGQEKAMGGAAIRNGAQMPAVGQGGRVRTGFC